MTTTSSSPPVRRPRSDERRLWDIMLRIYGGQAVAVALELKLFPLLAPSPLTVAEVAGKLRLAERVAETLLILCTSLDLLERRGDQFALTPLAEDYLLPESPTYFGGFLEGALIRQPHLSAFDTMKRAVLENRAQVYEGDDLFESHEQELEMARDFTMMMHGHSMAAALAWPERIDLSESRLMIDIGGGSGAHAIGASLRWPDLQAVVFEMPTVCEVALEVIGSYGLTDRITTHQGDLWNDPFPAGDLHFYGDIFHDWRDDKCRELAAKSFAALETGGRLMIHEVLYDDDKTGPFAAAAYSVGMLLWTEGLQRSGPEHTAILRDAGFADITVTPTFGSWSVVSGHKARR